MPQCYAWNNSHLLKYILNQLSQNNSKYKWKPCWFVFLHLLGHFLLTFLLLELLKRSAPSRIINLSSMAHAWGRIQLEDVHSERAYHPRRAYGQSKLANILSTRALSRRLQGQCSMCSCLEHHLYVASQSLFNACHWLFPLKCLLLCFLLGVCMGRPPKYI